MLFNRLYYPLMTLSVLFAFALRYVLFGQHSDPFSPVFSNSITQFITHSISSVNVFLDAHVPPVLSVIVFAILVFAFTNAVRYFMNANFSKLHAAEAEITQRDIDTPIDKMEVYYKHQVNLIMPFTAPIVRIALVILLIACFLRDLALPVIVFSPFIYANLSLVGIFVYKTIEAPPSDSQWLTRFINILLIVITLFVMTPAIAFFILCLMILQYIKTNRQRVYYEETGQTK
jgi:hypothetical protein